MYVVIEPIQSGTFSTVYKAWCDRRQQHVALKIIPRQNYGNEIEIMQLLGKEHPGICSMLDWYEDATNYVLVLEYCKGGDLYDFMEFAKRQGLRGNPLDLSSIILQIYSAISFAHSLGIAHRDIKPENILLTESGDVKLADWGHATYSRISNESNVGTDAYRAPETFTGHNYDTFEADYWSFGITILYLAFGKLPFKFMNAHDGSKMAYPFYCPDFANFLIDPQLAMYHLYIVPLLQSVYPTVRPLALQLQPNDLLYTERNSLQTYELIHLCRSVVEKLVNINAEQRNLDDFIHMMVRPSNSSADALQMKSSTYLAQLFRMIKVGQN